MVILSADDKEGLIKELLSINRRFLTDSQIYRIGEYLIAEKDHEKLTFYWECQYEELKYRKGNKKWSTIKSGMLKYRLSIDQDNRIRFSYKETGLFNDEGWQAVNWVKPKSYFDLKEKLIESVIEMEDHLSCYMFNM